MTDEFRVHRDVDELLRLLAPGDAARGAIRETLVDEINKDRSPFVSSQVSAHSNKMTIAEFSPTPESFLSKYDECHSRNYKHLDHLVSVLNSVVRDDLLRQQLEKNAKERAVAGGYSLQPPPANVRSSSTAPAYTPDEVDRLKERLLNACGTTSAYASADVLRRVLEDRGQPRKAGNNAPQAPPWSSERPHLSLNFKPEASGWVRAGEDAEPLDRMSVHEQEVRVIEDLLSLMEGVEGVYISSKRKSAEAASAGHSFAISNTVNASLKDLARRLLPVCANYATVVRFLEDKASFDAGAVNHALGAAMWNLMRDYFTLVAQLETQLNTGQLTLQKMWFYLQPTMRTFELLASICRAVDKGECKGGAVLSILHEKTTSMIGDAKAEELCLYLTQAACVPYFEMLQRWIYKGVISDPYAEFLVEENEDAERNRDGEDFSDNYWKKRYAYCHDQCPKFLETVAEKTLRTGKYLNVIRNCGRDVVCPHATELSYSLKSRQLTEHVERAYDYASKLLLDLLLAEKALLARLKSLKHYFLLDRGDFIVQFMDMAEEEMRKSIEDIVPSRLENLMELALRTSTAKQDPFNEDLRVHLFPYDLITQLFKVLSITESVKERDVDIEPIDDMNLSGLEAFSFDYTVEWPLSLVVSKMVLTRYQMLFRHLFYTKYVERQLSAIWTSCKGSKILGVSAGSSPWYVAACILRQRMIHFVTNLEYYMMFEVLEPNWHVFEQNMQKVANVDEVLEQHDDFLDNCMKDCLLTNSDLLRTVYKMMLICINFSNFLLRMTKSAALDHMRISRTPSATSLEGDAVSCGSAVGDLLDYSKGIRARVVAAHHEQLTSSDSFEKTIANFDRNFSEHLMDLLQKIYNVSFEACEHKLMNIIHRLDFNGYYKATLESRVVEKTKKSSASSSSAGAASSAAAGAASASLPAAGGPPQHSQGPPYSGSHHLHHHHHHHPVSVRPTSTDIPEEMNNDVDNHN